jgi:hypothetical protein
MDDRVKSYWRKIHPLLTSPKLQKAISILKHHFAALSNGYVYLSPNFRHIRSAAFSSQRSGTRAVLAFSMPLTAGRQDVFFSGVG